MIRRTRIAFVVGVLVLVAACGSQGGSLVGPEDRPALNGGGPLIGGNAVGDGKDADEGSATTTSTASSDSTSRGGGPLIGGN